MIISFKNNAKNDIKNTMTKISKRIFNSETDKVFEILNRHPLLFGCKIIRFKNIPKLIEIEKNGKTLVEIYNDYENIIID